MSEQVVESGTIEKVDLKGCTIEEHMEGLISKDTLDKYYSGDVIEALECGELEDYLYIKDVLYKITDHRSLRGEDSFNATDNKDGTIDFLLSYYNGGCGFSEALEYALEDIK